MSIDNSRQPELRECIWCGAEFLARPWHGRELPRCCSQACAASYRHADAKHCEHPEPDPTPEEIEEAKLRIRPVHIPGHSIREHEPEHWTPQIVPMIGRHS